MRSSLRWMMLAVLLAAFVRAAHAQIVDPTTGVVVDPVTDPVDFNAVAGGHPGNIGTELAAQAAAQAQKIAADAAAQAQQAAKAASDQASQNFANTAASASPTSRSPVFVPANSTAARPVITPTGGSFLLAPGGAIQVTISEKNPKATNYYTTDGSRPTLQSPVYTGPIAVSRSETIKVLATGKYENASAVVTQTFKIKH
jgi:type II secretory pathway pseudopilin PulG